MTITGHGNVLGFHYSKKNCEELIRERFEKDGYIIDKYNIPFPLAKEITMLIRYEYRDDIEYLSDTSLLKRIDIKKEDIDEYVKMGYITLK